MVFKFKMNLMSLFENNENEVSFCFFEEIGDLFQTNTAKSAKFGGGEESLDSGIASGFVKSFAFSRRQIALTRTGWFSTVRPLLPSACAANESPF